MNQGLGSLDQEAQQIIKTYTFLYSLIFRYGGFMIVAIAVVIMGSISLSSILLSPLPTTSSQQDIAISRTISQRLSQGSGIDNISLMIPGAFLSITGQLFQGAETMMTYHGLIMPRWFSFDRNINSSTFPSLLTSTYDLQTLKDFYQNIVFVVRGEITPPAPITLLSLQQGTLLKTFNLSCSLGVRIINGICDHYINQFESRMSAYDLSTHGNELHQLLSSTISRDTSLTQRLCIGLQKSLLSLAQYSKTINMESLADVMKDCSPYLSTNADRIQQFIAINNELSNDRGAAVISDTIYNDPLINAYKLLSAQQLIYQNIASNKPDIGRINGYLDFVQRLVNRPQSLSGASFDMIYYFHLTYLQPQLRNTQLSSLPDRTTRSTAALKKMTDIHQGNIIGEYPPLTDHIINKTLISSLQDTIISLTGSIISGSSSNLSSSFTEQSIRSYLRTSRLTIQSVSITDNNAIVQATSTIDSSTTKTLQIPTRIDIINNSGSIKIQAISLSGYQQLSTTISTIIKQQDLSLGQLYDTIISNKTLFDTTTLSQVSLCDSIKAHSELGILLKSCTPTRIELSQQLNNKTISYTISLSGNRISTMSSSHTGIQTLITIPKTDQTPLTIITTINDLLRITPPESTSSQSVSTSPLAIIEDLRTKRLGTKPTDIKPGSKEGKYTVDFVLDTISWKVQYDHPTTTIERILIIKDTQRIPVRNLSIVLQQKNADFIKRFATDPLSVVKEFDNAAYEAYNK